MVFPAVIRTVVALEKYRTPTRTLLNNAPGVVGQVLPAEPAPYLM